MIRRFLFVALLVTLIACGGGGGGSAPGGICSATAYTPNYATASGMTLRKWNHLPVKVFFATTTPIGATTIEEHAREGFDKWETALAQDLWTEVGTQGAADLVVSVQASAPQSTLATTTVFFQNGTVILSSATMTIYTWGSIPEADYNPTAAHEMGHALGMGGHSGSNLDIMYYTGNLSGLLTLSDLNTLRTIYCDFGNIPIHDPQPIVNRGPMGSETFVYPAK
jgi:hypothetical protein